MITRRVYKRRRCCALPGPPNYCGGVQDRCAGGCKKAVHTLHGKLTCGMAVQQRAVIEKRLLEIEMGKKKKTVTTQRFGCVAPPIASLSQR